MVTPTFYVMKWNWQAHSTQLVSGCDEELFVETNDTKPHTYQSKREGQA